MINQNKAFSRTKQLLKRYIQVEREFILKIVILIFLKNIAIVPVPFLIQMLVNDYLNLNIRTPIVLISFSIFCLILLSVFFDNLANYLTELLKRDLFTRNFHKAYSSLQKSDFRAGLSTYQIPRFLDVAIAQNKIAHVIKNLSQILVVIFVATLIIISYHPVFLVYAFILVSTTFAAVFFLYPRALMFTSSVSDTKYRANEFLMHAHEQAIGNETTIRDKPIDNITEEHLLALTYRYLKTKSSVFKIILSKSLMVGTIVALAHGIFIYLSGNLIIEQSFSVGQFVAAELVITYLLASIYNFVSSLEEFIVMVVSFDKMDSILTRKKAKEA